MSKKTGFCLHSENETVTVAEVRPMRQSWRVEALSRSSATNGPPADLVNRARGGAAGVTHLVSDEEIDHAIVGVPALRGKARERALIGVVARDKGGTPGEWRLSWKQFGETSRDGQRNHYLLFAKRAELDAHAERLQRWRLKATSILPEFVVLDQFFRNHGPDHAELGGWAVVFVGKQKQFVNICTNEVPLVVRSLPDDLSRGDDRSEYIDRLATEIDRSVYFARQTEHNPRIDKIFVCGEPELAAELVAHLGQTTAVAAEVWSVENQFSWGPHGWQPDELLLLMGAVLNFDKPEFNLLAAPGLLRLGHQAKHRLQLGAVTAGVTILPLLVGGGLITSNIQRDYLLDAEARLDEAQAEARAAEEVYRAQKVLLAREDRIATVADARPDLERIMLKLADLTPDRIIYRSLSIQERTAGHVLLRIEGTAEASTSEEAQAAFLEFLANLDNTDFLLRRTEPRLLKMAPGAGLKKGLKTTLFRVDLFLKRDTESKETQT